MLELGSVVLAIVEGAANALASRLLAPKKGTKGPIDIRVIVDEVAKGLRAKDKTLEVSIAEMAEALKSLRAILERLPEFDVQRNDKVFYRPRRDSDLGDVLYRLDEEIASLRGSAKSIAQCARTTTQREQFTQEDTLSLPSILKGLDEEITSLRSNPSKSTPSDDRSAT